MEIIPIFEKSLSSFKYDNGSQDEFARLFDLWNDPELLEEFFEKNKSDLNNKFWDSIQIEEAIIKTRNDASYFEKKLLKLSKKSWKEQTYGLETLFQPLDNLQTRIYVLNKSKARQSWLRIYALRVNENAFIITGGAIKLTKTMSECEHTRLELHKISKCKDFLKEKGVVDIDGVIEELEI